MFGYEKQKQEEKVKIARRKREDDQWHVKKRERIGGEGGTGGWKRKDAITIAKEIKDASVKEKMPGLSKQINHSKGLG